MADAAPDRSAPGWAAPPLPRRGRGRGLPPGAAPANPISAFYRKMPRTAIFIEATRAAERAVKPEKNALHDMLRLALSELVSAVTATQRILTRQRDAVRGVRLRYAETSARVAALRASYVSEAGYGVGATFDVWSKTLRATLMRDIEHADVEASKMQTQLLLLASRERAVARRTAALRASLEDDVDVATPPETLRTTRHEVRKLCEMLAGVLADEKKTSKAASKHEKHLVKLAGRLGALSASVTHATYAPPPPPVVVRSALNPLPDVLAVPPCRAQPAAAAAVRSVLRSNTEQPPSGLRPLGPRAPP